MIVEQAIFTSAKTPHREGYQLVAASRGVGHGDRRALSRWGPSHDSLDRALSLNYHALPSGAAALSYTTHAGGEYSGRGRRVYTHWLIVSDMGLKQFGNNPLSLLRLAASGGYLTSRQCVPEQLESLRLCTPAIDEPQACEQTAGLTGHGRLNDLIDVICRGEPVALLASRHRHLLLGGLLEQLPFDIRWEVSFTTGLKYSPRRPFQIHFADDARQLRRLRRAMHVIDLTTPLELPAGNHSSPEEAHSSGLRRPDNGDGFQLL